MKCVTAALGLTTNTSAELNMNTSRISKGDWIEYRHHEGWIADGKVLEVHPDGHFIVGSHDNDPSPNPVQPDEVTGTFD